MNEYLDLTGKTEKQKIYLEQHYLCCLCNSCLDLYYTVMPELLIIEEVAHCPNCDVHARKKEFIIQ